MTRQNPITKAATATRHKGMLTPSQTIHGFYQAIIDKDAEKIAHFYVPDERTFVVLEGPRQSTLGFTKIKKGWRDFCDSALFLQSIEWTEEGPLEEASGDMAWMAGVVNLTVALRGKQFTRKFRSSFVLRKSDSEGWRIQHEHVSAAMADPYGIGDWLKK
jgi:ketosteroid isomerase-like protein